MPEPNFIIGYGERLTERVPPPPRVLDERSLPYNLDEARQRLIPQAETVASDIAALPRLACPSDEAVAVMTLHPQFVAKSYFPGSLLTEARLRTVGSRSATIQPSAWTRRGEPEPSRTTELFVAGKREEFSNWPGRIEGTDDGTLAARQLGQIEQITTFSSESRVHLTEQDAELDSVHLEVVLHAGSSDFGAVVLAGLLDWSEELGVYVNVEKRFDVGGLTFLPATVRSEVLHQFSQFSFLRVARSMPRLRSVRPATVVRSRRTPTVDLPNADPLDSEIRVAMFDGGIETESELQRWVQVHDAGDVGLPDDDSLDHGFEVTGALLFGPLSPGVASQPYAAVDHFRVLDDKSDDDPEELYDVLGRIQDVLSTRDYEYVNLSIGPCLPIEDDDVHGWTVALDQLLADGSILLTTAVGNWGDLDRASGNARVQPPSDGVNMVGVGASDVQSADWRRASYSCVGPGRSPGRVKPDLVAFGGSSADPFFALRRDRPRRTIGIEGTSYASPLVLRTALGARAVLGARVTPLALRALLVHTCDPASNNREDVGWGRIPDSLEELIMCPAGTARVVYQGWLEPRHYLRAPIPIPNHPLTGFVRITATIAYAAPVDPSHAGLYTQAGLDVVFRPHSGRVASERGSTVAKSSAFFRSSDYMTEDELRRDAHKWESTLHRSRRMRGTSLQAPVFDIHYNARSAGADALSAGRIRYAAVISIEAPSEPNLYNEILTSYAGTLEALQPVIEVPVTVGV